MFCSGEIFCIEDTEGTLNGQTAGTLCRAVFPQLLGHFLFAVGANPMGVLGFLLDEGRLPLFPPSPGGRAGFSAPHADCNESAGSSPTHISLNIGTMAGISHGFPREN
jgi:hypothetical protein